SSSKAPSTKQSRNRCFASRLISLMVFITSFLLHRQLSGRFLRQPLLIVRRQNLAGDCCGSFHHQMAYLLLELGEHPRMILSRSFSPPRRVFLGFSARLLLSLRSQLRRGSTSLFNELTRFGIGPRQNLLALRLGLRQLSSYLFTIRQTLGDEFAPLRQH